MADRGVLQLARAATAFLSPEVDAAAGTAATPAAADKSAQERQRLVEPGSDNTVVDRVRIIFMGNYNIVRIQVFIEGRHRLAESDRTVGIIDVIVAEPV